MIVANRQEAVVRIPVVVPPVEVEVAAIVILVENEHVTVAVDLGDGALCEKPSASPSPDVASQGLYRICDLNLSLSFSHQLSLIF